MYSIVSIQNSINWRIHEQTKLESMRTGIVLLAISLLALAVVAKGFVPSLPLKAPPSCNRQRSPRMAYHDVFVQYTPRSSNNPKTWLKEVKVVDVPKEGPNKVYDLCEPVLYFLFKIRVLT